MAMAREKPTGGGFLLAGIVLSLLGVAEYVGNYVLDSTILKRTTMQVS